MSDSWATPQPVFDYMNKIYNFDLDACASDDNHKVKTYITESQNSLSIDWAKHGSRIWCNPPYSNIAPWVDKAIEAANNNAAVVMLVMCDPSVKWFKKALENASDLLIVTSGRISFDPPEGKKKGGNTKASCFFVFNNMRRKFNRSGCKTTFIDRDILMNGRI